MFKSLSLKVIVFGFIFTFFSSFGQSFFLGLFNSSIRDALSITHGQFGSIYAAATLLSSIVLVWIGKKIDDQPVDDIPNQIKNQLKNINQISKTGVNRISVGAITHSTRSFDTTLLFR